MVDLFDETLSKAKRDWFNDTIRQGGRCPCCERWGMAYTRAFNKTMARSLCWLTAKYLENGGEWVDVPSTAPDFVQRSKQLATCRWWGLIERRPNEDPAKKHSGMWRPTPKGISFVRHNLAIPKSVTTYDAEVQATADELVTLHEIFGQFHYQELMGEKWAGPLW